MTRQKLNIPKTVVQTVPVSPTNDAVLSGRNMKSTEKERKTEDLYITFNLVLHCLSIKTNSIKINSLTK